MARMAPITILMIVTVFIAHAVLPGGTCSCPACMEYSQASRCDCCVYTFLGKRFAFNGSPFVEKEENIYKRIVFKKLGLSGHGNDGAAALSMDRKDDLDVNADQDHTRDLTPDEKRQLSELYLKLKRATRYHEPL